MKALADRTAVALALVGLAYFWVPDLRAWIDGTRPVEVSCRGQ